MNPPKPGDLAVVNSTSASVTTMNFQGKTLIAAVASRPQSMKS
jgi:hypothetical protein